MSDQVKPLTAIIPRAPPPVPRRKDSLPPTPTKDPEEPALDNSLETVIDNPTSMSCFEAKTLWKDSYKTLYEFYQNKQLCDVEIQTGGKSFHCHRVVLACVSQYFRTMFTSEMAESRQTTIQIKDIEENAMQQLIDFAYTSKIGITIDNAQCLLYASSILQVESVAHACCQFMQTHLDPSNCIGIRNFAEQHGRTDLMKKADLYILDRFENVIDCEEYKTMSARHLESILASSNLNVDSEKTVFESVMKWINFDVPARKAYLAKMLGNVKLPLLSASYLMDAVAKNDLIKKDLECRDYLDEAKNYQLSVAQIVPELQRSERMRPRKSYAGVVFCVGGRGSSGDPFKSIECYDMRRDRWFPVADMSSRRRHVGVVSVGGRLYAVGGHDGTDHLNSGEHFDPETNKWRPIAPMATLRRGLALACLGGPIYAIGGLDDSACFNIVERYDPESDTWSFVQSMNMPRGGVAVATLKGYLYAIGGNDGTASLDSCERYDPHLNKWSFITSMNKRRAGAGVAHLYGQLYIIGGFDDNSPLDSVERFDPEQNKWEIITTMSCPRGGVGVTSLAGKIYAVGGHDGTNYLSTVEAYDPLLDSWERVCDISACRAGAGIVVLACRIEQLKDASKVQLSLSADSLDGNGERIGKTVQRRSVVRCSVVTLTSVLPSSPNQSPRADESNTVSGDTPGVPQPPPRSQETHQAPQAAPSVAPPVPRPANPAASMVAAYHSGHAVPVLPGNKPYLVVARQSSSNSRDSDPGRDSPDPTSSPEPSHSRRGKSKGRRKRHTYCGEPSSESAPPVVPRPRSQHDPSGAVQDDGACVGAAAAGTSGVTLYSRLRDSGDVGGGPSLSQPATPASSRNSLLAPSVQTAQPHSQPSTPSRRRLKILGFGNLRGHRSPEFKGKSEKAVRKAECGENNNLDVGVIDSASPSSSPEPSIQLITSPNNNTSQPLENNNLPDSPQPSTSKERQSSSRSSKAPLASPNEL